MSRVLRSDVEGIVLESVPKLVTPPTTPKALIGDHYRFDILFSTATSSRRHATGLSENASCSRHDYLLSACAGHYYITQRHRPEDLWRKTSIKRARKASGNESAGRLVSFPINDLIASLLMIVA
ncbi:hypothetical protein KIN20_004262 [Parelaphostrongylus tenuis]|uniref:Uncharacterized protein n=1 Tax=Parelaphostrongylus tenuis TaxID=148309 RepID=A0AAD5QF08_PARTN|nr:hypothetical protein KIN20_004262 [Parelaphostrongylus tenuis]